MIKIFNKLISEYIKTIGKGKFILFLLFGFLVSIMTVIEPLFFTGLIKKIESYYKTGVFDYNGFYNILIVWGIFIIFIILITFINRFYIIDKSSLNNYKRVFTEKNVNLLTMSYGEYLSKKTGSIYKNFDRGTGVQFSFIFWFLRDFLKNILSIIIIIGILFYIDWIMTLISLSMLPIMIYLGIYFNGITNQTQIKLNKKWDDIFGIIGDVMGNFLISKTLLLEKVFLKKISLSLDSAFKDQINISYRWSISDIYTTSLIAISRILVLGFGTFFVIKGTLSFASLFLFFSYIGWIYFPLGFIFGSFKQVQKELSEAENFYKEFENLESDIDQNKVKNIENIKGNIDFNNVGFGYSKKRQIFKKLNFHIKAGEKVAFVGHTGAGKSTIVNLLFRFWNIDLGEILLDGKNINNIKKDSLRSNIGIVMQDNSLFNTTIKENLLFAKPKATKKEIKEALQSANAEFVYDLENGIDTVIGERGLKLSGGEKQRISIARLFLKNPKILVLDEATSALDNKTEKLIQKSLDKLMKGRTSIVIAHRLSTIQNADKIFMLENGKIIEQGNYNELMNKKGKFYSLANPEHLILN